MPRGGARRAGPGRGAGRAPAGTAERPVATRQTVATPPGIALPESQDEWYVLLHAVSEPRWLEQVVEECRAGVLHGPGLRGVLRASRRSSTRTGGDDRGAALRSRGDTELQRVLARLEALRGRQDEGFELSDKAFRESLSRIHEDALERGVHERRTESTGDVLEDSIQTTAIAARRSRRDRSAVGDRAVERAV